MANSVVTASLMFADGTNVPLKNAAMAEGTLTEILTDTSFVPSAQSIGDYKPGGQVIAGLVCAEKNISYAYIRRQGLPIMHIPVAKIGVLSSGLPQTYGAVRLIPGDQLVVLCQAAATRTAALSVCCTNGVQRVFVATPTGAATNSLVDSVTGNDIGQTLTGMTVSHAYLNSIDGVKITSAGGAVILDAKGQAVGTIAATNPTAEQPAFAKMNARISLNFDAQVVTTS